MDMDPPTLREFSAAMTARLAGHRWVTSVNAGALVALGRLPGFERVVGLEGVAIEYMCSATRWRTERFAAFCAANDIPAQRVKDAYDALALTYALRKRRSFVEAA